MSNDFASYKNDPLPPTPIFDVRGQGNLSLAQVIDSTVIGKTEEVNIDKVEKLIQFIQNPPPFLSLHQLPPDIADFTGRQEELEKVTKLLRQQANGGPVAVISAVTGMAGVGKSALAIHAAHQLQSDFPDVQLYIDLRGAAGQPLEPSEVLAGWLRAWGMDDAAIPKDLAERASAYRSQLADKRALVLLDNARDEVQVRPLLPGGSTCAVLVTSRQSLGALEGASLLDLDVFPEAEARELLEKLLGRERVQAELEAAAQVLSCCGRLPLAIRIAGGTLKQKPHWRLADYAQKLADERQRLHQLHLSDLDVRASFALSYQELEETEARLFRFLGLLGADFAVEVAAVLVEVEPDAAETSLERLLDAQMLDFASEGRYQFHDLMRLFAREQLDQTEAVVSQKAAKQRVVQWYLEQSRTIGALLHAANRRQVAQDRVAEREDLSLEDVGQTLLLAALNWFEQERVNLLTTLDWADQAEAWDSVVLFALRLVRFFDVRGYWADWEKTHLLALEAARELGDRQSEGLTMMNLGTVYRQQGNWSEAIEFYQQSLPIFQALGDHQSEGLTMMNLGTVYRQQGDWSEAIEFYQQCLLIFQALGDRQSEGKTLANLGTVYLQQGHWSKAIDCFQQSLPIFQAWGDRQSKGLTVMNLGTVYRQQGHWSKAIEFYQQSLPIFQALGDHQSEGITLANLGLLYAQQNQVETAISLWQDALTKLHPDSPEFQQVTVLLARPPQRSLLRLLGGSLLLIAATAFLLSLVLTGRWVIAIASILVAVAVRFVLKALKSRL
ncbi:MAG: tetratricopeptide repeat protein [Xenococcaceae cyanobacterium]